MSSYQLCTPNKQEKEVQVEEVTIYNLSTNNQQKCVQNSLFISSRNLKANQLFEVELMTVITKIRKKSDHTRISTKIILKNFLK